MATWTPDPTFYPSPRLAAKAPPEQHAYVAEFDPGRKRPDRLAVVDVDPESPTYAQIVGRTAMPTVGDELHHFGWNACSSCLCPNAPHPHVERRYLIVPGLRSSNIHVLDTKPDPRKPHAGPDDRRRRRSPSGPATRAAHRALRPRGASTSAPSATRRARRPAASSCIDHETFDVLGRWEVDRGPQQFAYDVVVAPGPRHHGDQRVGHARHVRGRAQARAAPGRQVRPPAALLGPAEAQAPAGDRPRPGATSSSSSCARPTTPPRPTASSTPSCA